MDVSEEPAATSVPRPKRRRARVITEARRQQNRASQKAYRGFPLISARLNSDNRDEVQARETKNAESICSADRKAFPGPVVNYGLMCYVWPMTMVLRTMLQQSSEAKEHSPCRALPALIYSS